MANPIAAPVRKEQPKRTWSPLEADESRNGRYDFYLMK